MFVELTAPPDYKVEEHKGGLLVTLKNTVVPLKNNRRPLRVGAFDTAVTDVETHEKGRDTQVVISHQGRGGRPPRARRGGRRRLSDAGDRAALLEVASLDLEFGKPSRHEIMAALVLRAEPTT